MKTEADQFVNTYDGVTVKFIPGHNPDLVLYGVGEDAAAGEQELARVDLTKITDGASPSVDDLHALLADKGFKLKAADTAGGCTDTAAECASWAAAGECEKNTEFMHASCAKSCGCAPFSVLRPCGLHCA